MNEQIDVTTLEINELKALVLDRRDLIDRIAAEIQILRGEIAKREQIVPEIKPTRKSNSKKPVVAEV